MALLEAKKLGISFGGLRAVDDFNISIEKGALYGLIGPNCAGKTIRSIGGKCYEASVLYLSLDSI